MATELTENTEDTKSLTVRKISVLSVANPPSKLS